MNKRSSTVEPSSTIVLVRKRNIPGFSELKKDLDGFYKGRLKAGVKCTVCRTRRIQTFCNCGLRYCSINKYRSNLPICTTRCKTKQQDIATFRDNDEGKYKVTNGKNRERFHEKSDRTKYDDFISEGSDADDYQIDDMVDGREVRHVQRYDESESASGTDTSIRRGLNVSLRQCNRDVEGEEKSEKPKMKEQSELYEDIHWITERKNKFGVGEILKVQILQWEDNQTCWVRLFENFCLYERMENFLNKHQEKYPAVESLSVDKLYLVKYEGKWYRGMITDLDPLIVRCVDAGVKFRVNSSELKELDPKFASLKGLAFKVLVSEGSRLKQPAFGLTKLRIRDISRMTYEVNIIADIQPPGNEPTLSLRDIRRLKSSRRNVIDNLLVGMCGVFVSTDVQCQTMTGYLVPDELQEAMTAFRHVGSLRCADEELTEAEVGDMVLVQGKKTTAWRGIVKSRSEIYGYEVNLVDLGFALFSKKVYKMPETVSNLLDLAVRAKFTPKFPESFRPRSDHNYLFEVKEKLFGGSWLCTFRKNFESEEFREKVILERVYNPSHRIQHIPLQPDCNVKIAALGQSDLTRHGADFVVYVRRMDEYFEQFLEIEKAVQKLPDETDKSFSNKVEAGDFVAAKFDDGLYYRALVVSRTTHTAGVLYLDYGNEAYVKVKDLKPLPYNLIEEPVHAREIPLIGHDILSSIDYVRDLMENEKDLILHYSGDILDGAVLLDKAVYRINRYLFSHIPNKCIGFMDKYTVRFYRQSNRSPGLVRNFVVLFVDEAEFTKSGLFWAASPKHVRYVVSPEQMHRDIQEYCRARSTGYSPRDGELCLALFQGNWFRALSTGANGRNFEVFFVDFGNREILQSRSIRRANRQFFRQPPLAMRCILDGFENLTTAEVMVALDYLDTKVNGSIELAEIVEVTETGSVIQIPELYNVIRDFAHGDSDYSDY